MALQSFTNSGLQSRRNSGLQSFGSKPLGNPLGNPSYFDLYTHDRYRREATTDFPVYGVYDNGEPSAIKASWGLCSQNVMPYPGCIDNAAKMTSTLDGGNAWAQLIVRGMVSANALSDVSGYENFWVELRLYGGRPDMVRFGTKFRVFVINQIFNVGGSGGPVYGEEAFWTGQDIIDMSVGNTVVSADTADVSWNLKVNLSHVLPLTGTITVAILFDDDYRANQGLGGEVWDADFSSESITQTTHITGYWLF